MADKLMESVNKLISRLEELHYIQKDEINSKYSKISELIRENSNLTSNNLIKLGRVYLCYTDSKALCLTLFALLNVKEDVYKSCNNIFDQTTQQHNSLCNTLSHFKTSLNELFQDINSLTNLILNQREALRINNENSFEIANKCYECQENLSQISKMIDDFPTQIRVKLNNLQEIESDRISLQIQLKNISEILSQTSKQNVDLKILSSDLKSKLSSAQNQLRTSQLSCRTDETGLKYTSQHLVNVKTELLEKKRGLETLKEVINERNLLLTRYRNENEILVKHNQELEMEIATIKERIRKVDDGKKQLEETFVLNNEKNENVEFKINIKKRKLSEIRNENRVLVEKRDIEQKMIDTEIGNKKKKLKKIQKHYEKMCNEFEANKEGIIEMEKKIVPSNSPTMIVRNASHLFPG